MFWFTRNRTIELHCYTSFKSIAERYPIKKGNEFLPNWFKNSKSYLKDDFNIPIGTMKACPSIQDYLLKSIIIPLWSDVNIMNVDGALNVQAPLLIYNRAMIETHAEYQWDIFANKEKEAHVKFVSPWLFKTNEKVSFLFTKAFYHNELFEDIEIVPGIIDYYSQRSTNINLFISKRIKHRLLLAGTPLISLVPLTNKPIKVINHLITEEEFRRTTNPYGNSSFIKRHIKKCPFHK